MSPLANNPPPAPHINLTGLKIALAKHTSGRGPSRDGGSVVKREDVNDEIEKVNGMIEYYNQEGGNNMGDITSKVDVKPYKWESNRPASEVSKFIQRVDNTNAVSAIGTLEFLDEISKFYTTKIVCQVSNEMFENAKDNYGYTPYLDIIKDDYQEEGKNKLRANKKEKGITTITNDGQEYSTAGRIVSLESSMNTTPTLKVGRAQVLESQVPRAREQQMFIGDPQPWGNNYGDQLHYLLPPAARQGGGGGRRGKRTSNKRRKRTSNKRRKRTIRKK